MNSLISTPERTKNLKRFEGKARTCANKECGRRLSRYNDHLFCWQCLRIPKFANMNKLHCRNDHNLIEVGKTNSGVCKACAEEWKAKSKEETRYHLPNLQRIKNESGQTWREVWTAIGKPKGVNHYLLVNYSTYRNGKPKSRCPESIALDLAEHFGVTLEDLTGEGE